MKIGFLVVVVLAVGVTAKRSCRGLTPDVSKDWCNLNCNFVPAFCPEESCQCDDVADVEPSPVYCAGIPPATNGWCDMMCNFVPPFCPSSHCSCSPVGGIRYAHDWGYCPDNERKEDATYASFACEEDWHVNYPVCGDGLEQSPININPAETVPSESTLSFSSASCSDSSFYTTNLEWKASFNCPEVNVNHNGKTYTLLQVHVHHASEHTWEGNYAPMEAHLVHTHEDGSVLVVGVGIMGEASLEDDNIIIGLMDSRPDSYPPINPYDILVDANTDDFYEYSGSFTTPPCTEGVTWLVSDQIQKISTSALNRFVSHVMASPLAVGKAGNYRNTQPLNGRSVGKISRQPQYAHDWGYCSPNDSKADGAFDSFACEENWSDNYDVCASGTSQSPINLDIDQIVLDANTVGASTSTLSFSSTSCSNSSFYTTNLEWKASFNCPDVNLQYNGETYTLAQVHVHSLSEHTFSGAYYPMEAHMVHLHDDGSVLVVGVPITAMGELLNENEFIGLMDTRPDSPPSINPYDLIPAGDIFYEYSGSFTTPPCTEGVSWLVSNNPLTVSESVFGRFLGHVMASPLAAGKGGNYRDTQPLNDRFVSMLNLGQEV